MTDNKNNLEQLAENFDGALKDDALLYQQRETKTGKEQMKLLHGKKRMEFFLEYYGKKVLGISVFLLFLLYVAVHYLTTPGTALNILAVNATETELSEEAQQYFQDFLTKNQLDPKKNEVHVNQSIYVDANSMDAFNKSSVNMTITLFTTQAVDLFLSDEDFFRSMAIMGYIADLRTYLSEEQTSLIPKEDLIYVNTYETGEELLVGIRLKPENSWISRVKLYDYDAIIGISDGARNPETARKMLNEIIE